MQRPISLLVVVVLSLGLVACGGSKSDSGTSAPSPQLSWDQGNWNEKNWQ